ncbi:hypothetical protein ARMSODRAFT_1017619 [Armillaria solidipes]|uniref:Uncharacterized protein n=1 Tax=Armillaria solidipes TaxID=1076256 RepID=A0A2H3C1W6_9AGAR|nr:hypothetical protein ARMSODRAFT_1017619 [Armillaria solidipes]
MLYSITSRSTGCTASTSSPQFPEDASKLRHPSSQGTSSVNCDPTEVVLFITRTGGIKAGKADGLDEYAFQMSLGVFQDKGTRDNTNQSVTIPLNFGICSFCLDTASSTLTEPSTSRSYVHVMPPSHFVASQIVAACLLATGYHSMARVLNSPRAGAEPRKVGEVGTL